MSDAMQRRDHDNITVFPQSGLRRPTPLSLPTPRWDRSPSGLILMNLIGARDAKQCAAYSDRRGFQHPLTDQSALAVNIKRQPRVWPVANLYSPVRLSLKSVVPSAAETGPC
jgi:hypothetical protein